ncbi:MAG: YgiQ family radical SAM protein [Paludibacteraceae bacterium]|nr:YgiQ family radical SAM protein [Paludibacteraceae bacterium]
MPTVLKSDFLPTTKKEMEVLGWEDADIIIFSGDAYVDHPSFGMAVIGRTLEAAGYRVAIVPQPDWHGDYRDFRKLGRPRLFFAITAGSMDSMVNHYTANRRRRSDDAYTPDGRPGMRPDYCTTVYSRILKQLFPDVPVVIGGVEASMRRLCHYDYWQDKLLPSVLCDSQADVLVYGMAEKAMVQLAQRAQKGESLLGVLQTAYIVSRNEVDALLPDSLMLHSFEECLKSKRAYAENFRQIERNCNTIHGVRLIEPVANRAVVVEPMNMPMTTQEIDASFDLPYMRLPHPKYKGKTIPAYEMIKFSVNMHRGCFGGCAFCTISAHQGKQVVSRSKQSILSEIRQITKMPDFKGYLSDLGGPSANMYQMHGKDMTLCEKCHRPTCLQPKICPNLNQDFAPLLDIYRAVDAMPGIKKSFIGSGIRYDLMSEDYGREVILHHVSGRLKVAPEHTQPHVLTIMRKPSFDHFEKFRDFFMEVNREAGINQQIIPYFISSHPGCTVEDMAELAVKTKQMNFQLEQVQDFTPTPMTLATTMYYTGLHPDTMQPVFVARTKEDKLRQRQFFFWYKPEEQEGIRRTLMSIHRPDLVQKLLRKNKGKNF